MHFDLDATAPYIFFLFMVLLCAAMVAYNRAITRNEIARFHQFLNGKNINPVKAEVVRQPSVEEGSTAGLRVFYTGTIVFDNNETFVTHDCDAFDTIQKLCKKRNENFLAQSTIPDNPFFH